MKPKGGRKSLNAVLLNVLGDLQNCNIRAAGLKGGTLEISHLRKSDQLKHKR